jgi:hypothetical protein
VTGWEPTSGHCWGGRPIARRVADCAPRRRAVLTGTIVSTETSVWHRTAAFICELDDDTGHITVVFDGPRAVPGMVKGALCTVEATVVSNGRGLFLWDPFYRFEP